MKKTNKILMAAVLVASTAGLSAWSDIVSFDTEAPGRIADGDLNTAHGQTVEPLPFHGMSRYPYGADEAYPSDPEHRRYLETYNTRYVGTEAFTRALVGEKE